MFDLQEKNFQSWSYEKKKLKEDRFLDFRAKWMELEQRSNN